MDKKIYKMTPAVKDAIWGGDKLRREWNKVSGAPIAESWELSFHKDGVSLAGGLPVTEALPRETWGTNCARFKEFPVLIKFIDAAKNLSVQVHPADDYALKHENSFGKTEMWYIADSEPGAGIYCGFKRAVSPAEYAAMIEDGSLTDALNFFKVKKGETYFLEAGTVHAICAGVTVYEIQQSSNLTYRVYDYGRTDKDGNPRALHIEQAKAVSNLSATGRDARLSCNVFDTRFLKVSGGAEFYADAGSFCSITFFNGSGTIEEREYIKGDTFFVPAGYGCFRVEGDAEIALVTVPDEA